MLTESEARRLVLAHSAARERMTVAASRQAEREVQRFTAWYETAAIAALTLRISLMVEAAQRQTAAVTDAYFARVLSKALGRSAPPLGRIEVGDLRVGITHPGAYGRVADQYRYDVSRGVAPTQALERATERAGTIARTDVDLAFRKQAQAVLEKAPVSGYRRVIHPELSRGGSCGLCVVASDRVYFKADLLPIHDNCRCGILPIFGDDDPGSKLNKADLKGVYAAAGSTGAADLKRTRFVVHQHGELGPVLREAGDEFRSPSDVAESTTH